MTMDVISGYAAVNLSCDLSDRSKDRWIGIIQGNIYCKTVHKDSKRALRNAEKLYNKLIK